MNFQKLIEFLWSLSGIKFTGRVILDFHEGNISKKVKKEITEVIE